jgi:RNA polymerase sigma-70 factor, ECF subfamily
VETVGEARLVVQALGGSQSAFEQIVGRYQRPVISLIARITGDRTQAEDLAQETFVKAFRNLAAFDTTRRLSSWLFRIAHNTAIDAMRRSRPPPASIDATHIASAAGRHEPSTPPEPDPVERQELA